MTSTIALIAVLSGALSLADLANQVVSGQPQPAVPQAKELLDRRKEIKAQLADATSELQVTRGLRKKSQDGADQLVATLQARVELLKRKLNAGPPPKKLENAIRETEDDIRRVQSSQKETDDALLLMESVLLKRAARLREELNSLDAQPGK